MFRALNKDKCGVMQQQPVYVEQKRMVDPMFKASQSYVPSPPQLPRRTWSDTFRGMFGRNNNNNVNTTVRDDEYNIAGGKKKKIRTTKRKSGSRGRKTKRRM
jgi:hypothetical protein